MYFKLICLLFTLPVYLTFKDDLEMRRNTIVVPYMENMLDKSPAIYIECHLFLSLVKL